jgi:hypothetical protein
MPKRFVVSTVLLHEGNIGLAQCEQTNQLCHVFGKDQQLKAFCSGKQFTARHNF